MTSFICFLKNPSLPRIHIPFLVITFSISLSISGGIWLKTCILVLVLLSPCIFTCLSKLDYKRKNQDLNVSNESERKLLFPESHLQKDDHSDVLVENGGSEKIVNGSFLDLCRSSLRIPEGTGKIASGKMDYDTHQEVGDVSYSESESNDISFSSSSPDVSDGSISDEESLIELEIPSGIYVASPTTHTKKGQQEEDQEFISKFSNFHPFKDPMFDFFDAETKRMYRHQSILDLLADFDEMNMEEDNLIEIDIARGSIKCPRFEIEA